MNVLVATVNAPHPQRGGGANRTFQLLRYLRACGDHLTLLCVATPDEEHYVDAVHAVCDRVDVIPYFGSSPWRPRLHVGNERLDRYATLLVEPPYRYAHTFASALIERAQALLATGRFDVLVVEHTAVAFVLAPIKRGQRIPAVAVLHNIESILHTRMHVLDRDKSMWARTKHTVTRHKIRNAERAIANAYPLVAVTSDHDAAALDRVVGRRVGAAVVPNGVDTAYFHPLPSVPVKPHTLVFTGLMAHAPNADGVRYFRAEILPLIHRCNPLVRLLVVGAEPPADVREMDEGENGNVRILGAVPDTRPYIAEGSVIVVPLRSGSGTRLKILEALAMEQAVVSTTIGAEGLQVIDGRHVLIADDPTRFAAAVLRLLEDRTLAASLGASGRVLVERRYRWESIGEEWRRTLHALVSDTASAGGHPVIAAARARYD